MKRFSLPALSAAVLAAACGTSAFAQVTVKDPWVRATVPQQMATGAFMQLSAPAEARLVEVRVERGRRGRDPRDGDGRQRDEDARRARHRAARRQDRRAEARRLPRHADGPEAAAQGGRHGALTLVVEGKDKKRETVEVKAPVRQLNRRQAARPSPERLSLATRAPRRARPARRRRYLASAFSASLMPSLTPTSGGSNLHAAAASRSL